MNASAVFPNASNCTDTKNRIFTPHGSFSVMLSIACLLPVICIMGIIGNIGSFIIMKESGKKVSSHFFIKILTIFDCLSLIFFLPPVWMQLTLRSVFLHMWPGHFTWIDDLAALPFQCEMRLYVTFVTRTISIYIIVAFTLERALMVLWPYKGQKWCTMRNARIATAVTVVFAAIVNLPCLFAYKRRHLRMCNSAPRIACQTIAIFFRWRYACFVVLSIIPSFIIATCNAAIIWTLVKSRQASYIDADQQKERKVRDKEITRRLLLVSTTFIVLNTPLLIVTSAHNYFELRKRRHHKRGAWANAFHISLFLFYMNLAINFVLYCFTGRAFRRAALALFSCNLEEMRHQRHRLDEASNPHTASTGLPPGSRRDSDRSPRVSLTGATPRPSMSNPDAFTLSPLQEVNESA